MIGVKVWRLLDLIHKDPLIRFSTVFFTLILFGMIFYKALGQSLQLESSLAKQIKSVTTANTNAQAEIVATKYQNHLIELNQKAIEAEKAQLENQYQQLVSEEASKRIGQVDQIYSLYHQMLDKYDRNGKYNIEPANFDATLSKWGRLLLDEDFATVSTDMGDFSSQLDQVYQQYLASLPTPTPISQKTTQPISTVQGYSQQTVTNTRGSFTAYVIKLPLSSIIIKTLAANTTDCNSDCPTKPLAQYVQENQGYAGMNGTYFCPPDYAACVNEKNAYDFGVFDSNAGEWRNSSAILWNDLGLFTYTNSALTFYEQSKSFAIQPVAAGLSNFPTLLINGNVVVDEAKLSSYQKDVRGVRGAVGTDNTHIYLVVSTPATVTDMAYIMQSLGNQNALNLDGGGSSALYIAGSYKVGPGRALPNAIVLINR